MRFAITGDAEIQLIKNIDSPKHYEDIKWKAS